MDEMFFVSDNWLETLIKCREPLKNSKLLRKLDEIIEMELEMARIGSRKALDSVTEGKGHLRSIK